MKVHVNQTHFNFINHNLVFQIFCTAMAGMSEGRFIPNLKYSACKILNRNCIGQLPFAKLFSVEKMEMIM